MKYRLNFSVLLFFLLVFSAAIQSKPVVNLSGDEHSGFQADLNGNIEYVSGQIFQLLDAMPQDKMDWRPAEGVRSVSEVYLHIAFANYLIVKFCGGTAPDEISMDGANAWDSQTLDKKEIAEILKKSFEDLKMYLNSISDPDLETMIEAFGMTMSKRAFLISMSGHMHEHLGQSIAYARMNGVTPPWSKE